MEKQVHVSFYASLFRTECKVLTLEEIIILIRRRRWKNEILAYRTAPVSYTHLTLPTIA